MEKWFWRDIASTVFEMELNTTKQINNLMHLTMQTATELDAAGLACKIVKWNTENLYF